jgi:hypothetical protein
VGKTALEKQEFPAALAHFRLVDRDAPKFQGVDALIADTIAKQQKAVDVAIDSGQQNETANKILEARRWYDVALQRDPASTVAREKRAAVVRKMNGRRGAPGRPPTPGSQTRQGCQLSNRSSQRDAR